MFQEIEAPAGPRRRKLGLALAGGGFRATLFHLGVLRRLAELDLLRRVEVLSTVSGGSVIGALYVLLLKRELDRAPDANLTRAQYIGIVDELDDILVDAIQKNLRLRLLANPLGILRVLLTEHSLARRMARLYERHVYRRVVEQLAAADAHVARPPRTRPGMIRMRDIRMYPPGMESISGGLEAYNPQQIDRGRSVVTGLVLNATSLNSGGRFWFSSSEVGDWHLGQFRFDELPMLLDRKHLLEERTVAELRAAPDGSGPADNLAGASDRSRTAALLAWWKAAVWDEAPKGWEAVSHATGLPGALRTVELGRLRQAKVPAWFARGGGAADGGGLGVEQQWHRLLAVIRAVDVDVCERVVTYVGEDKVRRAEVADLVIELYWIRNAERVSSTIERDWSRLSLGDAVGASACFPPVFAPFTVTGLYDDAHVSRLGLSDGGVYDNMGITALLEERCTDIIASDTSGLFDVQQRVASGRVGMGVRLMSVLTNAVATLQREDLRHRRRVAREIEEGLPDGREGTTPLEEFAVTDGLASLAFFHITSPRLEPPGPAPLALDTDPREIAGLRTDLDAFGDVEIAALVNHGYDMADRYARRYLTDHARPEWSDGSWAPRAPRPHAPAERTSKVLRVGGSGFFRAARLGSPLAIGFLAAAVLVPLAWAWWRGPSIDGAAATVAGWLGAALGSLIPESARSWLDAERSLALALTAALAYAVFTRFTGIDVVALLRHRSLRLARRIATGLKHARSLAGNLLWIVGLLPAVVAAASTVVAALSWVFFHRPFLARTRIAADRAPPASDPGG